MNTPIYSPLLTDFYQLTMAYGYWQLNMHEQNAVFHLLFRKNPFKGNYAIAAGLDTALSFLKDWRFSKSDISFLQSIKNNQNQPMFAQGFLDYLAELRFTGDIDAIAEGNIVFPHLPLIKVTGSLLQCQLIESALLNIINFQSLIATKASRVCRAAGDDEVIEFGMRRAQGPDGALSASRGAYIGGCVATSNTLAGKLFGIPLRGTHAHSWVTAFPSEAEAFNAYAAVMPHHATLLVDTYNTTQGVLNAIETGKKLRQEGADLIAIRLDSGDMAKLSIEARKLLDDAGFHHTQILASNSLDEYTINSLKEQGAKITMWGVGTSLVTAYDTPALDGVYKLAALQSKDGKWEYKLKLSEQEIKVSNPGRHQVRRFYAGDQYVTDVIYDIDLGISEQPDIVLLDNSLKNQRLENFDSFQDLLVPVMRNGTTIETETSIHQIRQRAKEAASCFHRHHGNQSYTVAIEKNLYELKQKLIQVHKNAHSPE